VLGVLSFCTVHIFYLKGTIEEGLMVEQIKEKKRKESQKTDLPYRGACHTFFTGCRNGFS